MALDIDQDLLARAVESKIRPLLITKGYLNDGKHEAYHHSKVIPKASALLTRQSLVQDGRKAVIGAINASVNLLSQFEKMQSGDFLKTRTPSDVRDFTIDLLFGKKPLVDRITDFLKWGGTRPVKVGTTTKKIGFNATAASYLLAMSDPAKYAFCKPNVYKAAARSLLGESEVATDAVMRVVHCTDFYKAALELFRTKFGLDRFTDLMHCHVAFYIMDHYDDVQPTWDTLSSWNRKNEVDPEKEEREVKPMPAQPHPLNMILYGPPGTGKTYHTISRAVHICDGKVPAERRELSARFNELRDQGRIEFVTFHQSYGYEEFVEGIRPVLASDGGQGDSEAGQELRYERHDGVFKVICDSAKAGLTTARHGFKVDLSKHSIWKMSLGNTLNPEDAEIYEECLRQGQIRLGYGNGKDYTGCDDIDAVLEKVREALPKAVKRDYAVASVHRFKNEMRIGDLVIISDGNKMFRAIGKVTGEYEHVVNDEYDQVRRVEWLLKLDDSLSVDTIMRLRFSQLTLYQLNAGVLRLDALSQLLSGKQPAAPLPCVLIIDEINRGNISKIFGELITLIEPDKRLGAENELRVTLPHSHKPFGVPANLYLIGTMNTADRSIAFLDTALRRRFRFQEMMPDLQVIRDHVGKAGIVDGIDVAALLEAINHRVELLYDRDHQIGHSYFMGVDSLTKLHEIFTYQVIPLLQEYFHDDWIKVCQVLACPYDEETGEAQSTNELPLIVVVSLDESLMNASDRESVEPRFRYTSNPGLQKPDLPALKRCFGALFSGRAAGVPDKG